MQFVNVVACSLSIPKRDEVQPLRATQPSSTLYDTTSTAVNVFLTPTVEQFGIDVHFTLSLNARRTSRTRAGMRYIPFPHYCANVAPDAFLHGKGVSLATTSVARHQTVSGLRQVSDYHQGSSLARTVFLFH